MPLFAATDVLVSSSPEGMAYSVLEALASGLPVVASKIPGHSFLGDHIAACRVVETDPAQLAQAVRTTIERSPAAAEAEREQASVWLAENLAAEVLAERLVDLYTEILD